MVFCGESDRWHETIPFGLIPFIQLRRSNISSWQSGLNYLPRDIGQQITFDWLEAGACAKAVQFCVFWFSALQFSYCTRGPDHENDKQFSINFQLSFLYENTTNKQ